MASALLRMGRIKGVARPAIATPIPVPGSTPTVLLDAGANAEVQPEWLVQFGQMGAVYARHRFGTAAPKVGLLSIGEEAGKGDSLRKEAFPLLAVAPGIDFIGNVEGRDITTGEVDVVVTDGFTGNVVLKTIEGTARAVGDAVGRAARSGPVAAAGGLLLRPALGGVRAELDPDRTGGAILLGLRGVAVVGHGSAGPLGIANQIRLAARAASERSVERTAELIERSGAGRGAIRAARPDGES
jgi:glycerol-3-phosphate acyltransferase PlsX